MTDNLIGLIGALAGVPVLAGARCRHKHAQFDDAQPGESDETLAARHAQAMQLCLGSGSSGSGCPAFAACESWFLSMPPSRRPTGVIAGRVNHHHPRRQSASVNSAAQMFDRGDPDHSRGSEASLPPHENSSRKANPK